ncbi:hypothetical protein HMPREF0970_01942 [Schaalia odontolytica F0309]|uniref:Uncharacterized protein n=1 Tax=Schaalia odontolytica F0309 TaxID=649742 RepID=D4U144_9ACTO|nr:hypothetical protein HMPREF0970_01942 [Schaalia odontolytica F0309]
MPERGSLPCGTSSLVEWTRIGADPWEWSHCITNVYRLLHCLVFDQR